MKLPRFFTYLVAVLFFATLVAGCVPESINPLSAPAAAVVDKRLEGVWSKVGGTEGEVLHIGQRSEVGDPSKPGSKTGQWMEILSVNHSTSGSIHHDSYVMFPSSLASGTYLNLRAQEEHIGKIRLSDTYLLTRYAFDWRGRLTLWRASESLLAEAIESGKLRGKVTRSKGSHAISNVTITDSTEHLAAFVAASDPKQLFSDSMGPYRKLRVP